MLRNKKGVVALAIILSVLMAIGAIAVIGFVSGQLGVTYRLHRRPQAILDAESASYVAYMMMRNGDWERNTFEKKVTFKNANGTLRKEVKITILAGNSEVRARSPYK